MASTKHLHIVSLVLAFGWGCNSAPKSSSGDNNSGKYSTTPATGTDNSPTSAANASANKGTPASGCTSTGATLAGTTSTDRCSKSETEQTTTGRGPADGTPATPGSWCANAALTNIVTSASHTQGFQALCENGQPTALFSSLIASPYTGNGTPVPTMITPVADAKGSVSAFFGIGLKLPISSAIQFNTVGPEQGVVANEKSLMKAQGQSPKSCTITSEVANPDKFWTRGWSLSDSSSQTVFFINVNTIYTYQADQYNFDDGSYMYTATFTPPAASGGTLQNYQLLTAGLDIDGTGYLITIGNLAADDHGVGSVAITAVNNTITSTIKFIYSSAVAAK